MIIKHNRLLVIVPCHLIWVTGARFLLNQYFYTHLPDNASLLLIVTEDVHVTSVVWLECRIRGSPSTTAGWVVQLRRTAGTCRTCARDEHMCTSQLFLNEGGCRVFTRARLSGVGFSLSLAVHFWFLNVSLLISQGIIHGSRWEKYLGGWFLWVRTIPCSYKRPVFLCFNDSFR